MPVDPHHRHDGVDLATGQGVAQAQAGAVAGLFQQAHLQAAQGRIDVQPVLPAQLRQQGGDEGRDPVQAGLHAQRGVGGVAGLAVDPAALRGGGQRGEEGLRALRIGQGRLQAPIAERGDRLRHVLALLRGVVGFLLHVLAAEQDQGADGLVDVAVGAGELAAKCRHQLRFSVLFLQSGEHLRQTRIQWQFFQRPAGAAFAPAFEELRVQGGRHRQAGEAAAVARQQAVAQHVHRLHRPGRGLWRLPSGHADRGPARRCGALAGRQAQAEQGDQQQAAHGRRAMRHRGVSGALPESRHRAGKNRPNGRLSGEGA